MDAVSAWTLVYEYRAYAPEAMAPVLRYSCIIDAVLRASSMCRKAGGTLVFIVDNCKVDARAKSFENEKSRAAAAYSAWQASPQDTKILRGAFKVSDELQEAVLTALRADGFDVVQAPQLALMFREGLLLIVMSSDTDFIAYGVTRLISRWNVLTNACTVNKLRKDPNQASFSESGEGPAVRGGT